MRVSVSRIKLFKACRRAYQLKYVEGLEPIQKAEALAVGTGYHSKLEELYEDGSLDTSDLSKESAMASAYQRYIYPLLPVKAVEQWYSLDIGGGNELVGRVDGIADDGNVVEHKTTSLDIDEFVYNLEWDEQVLAYMLLTGKRKVWYTVCKKPTIRQKKSESDEEFFERMVEWYDGGHAIDLFTVNRTDEQVAEFSRELREIVKVMADPEMIPYRNTAYCTHWGRRCEYASICLWYKHGDKVGGFVERGNGDVRQDAEERGNRRCPAW